MVTAIVGPNGSGKSNIVDAILWVLGEQSPSLLRLKSMGDLVFAGSVRRPAAGAAEVTLRLSAGDGLWSDTDGRLDVTRRVYRKGPSDYRLNGRSQRLRDVQDALLAVGLGTRAYAIIEQGRVGQVLSARPVDRRALLEEAAGISQYKARRHSAELKLEATKQNLLRLEDVVAEVDRSLRQLRRQARAAERYKKLEAELNELLRDLYRSQAGALKQQREALGRTLAQAENESAATAAALASVESELTEQRELMERVRSDRDAAREEVAALQSSCERRETFLSRSADLLDNLRTALERLQTEARGVDESIGSLRDHVAAAEARRDELGDTLTIARQQAEVASEEHAKRLSEAQEAESLAGERRQQLLRCISSLTESRNRLGDLERELDRLSYSMTSLQHERERVATRYADANEQYEAARQKAASAAKHHQDLDARRHHLEHERNEVDDQIADVDHRLERLGDDQWNLRHTREGIERQLARTQAAVDQVTAVLADEDVFGQVSDYLHPAPELAPVLDRVWRELLDLPVISVAASRSELVQRFATSDGRLRMAVRRREEAAQVSTTATTLPDSVAPLLDQAGVPEEDRGWIAGVLPPAFRCADESMDVRALAEEHPHARFLDANGLVHRGGTIELPASGKTDRGVLALRAERDSVAERIGAIDAQIAERKERRESLLRERQQLSSQLNELGPQLLEAQQEQARATTVEQSLGSDVRRLRRELEALDSEIERTGNEHREASERQGRLTEEVTSLERRGQELEASMEAATEAVERHRASIGAAARELDQCRGHERLAAERAQTATADLERLQTEAAELERRQRVLGSESESTAQRLQTTESEVVTTRTKLAEEQGMLASARERERRLREQSEKVGGTLAQLESEVAQRRRDHEARREQVHELQMERTRLTSSWEALAAQVVNELGTSLELLMESAAGDVGPTEEELSERITTTRERLDKIGPVNLLAVREEEELSERSTFLTTQRKDLVDSIRSLEGTISEIDTTCTERFVATFNQVNEVFLETFAYLFGGGSAKLILVDEDDPLESGIDIIAQPPGKKNQSVQLLSGGEKALAALSLLISLFRIKPSPFCILDEVDAPLDDANVERLADIVHAMTEHTQFVMITHNRRTMARADVLYGVTMEEPGASKVVSVRMEE
jgi:chromosome segregation protein